MSKRTNTEFKERFDAECKRLGIQRTIAMGVLATAAGYKHEARDHTARRRAIESEATRIVQHTRAQAIIAEREEAERSRNYGRIMA